MDRDWLAARLEAGDSIEGIAREVGKHPSTVSYWVNKHGLKSGYVLTHAARGPLPRDVLAALVEAGLSVRQIATEVDRSPTTVRHWLRHHELETQPARYAPRHGAAGDELLRECELHGFTWFRRVGASPRYRCARCCVESVSNRRRRVKQILVDEAGGRCSSCGYDAHPGVLQFHHLDPASKASTWAARASPARSSGRAKRRASACCCAQTATRRSNWASSTSRRLGFGTAQRLSG